jgi:hypothetical protein
MARTILTRPKEYASHLREHCASSTWWCWTGADTIHGASATPPTRSMHS